MGEGLERIALSFAITCLLYFRLNSSRFSIAASSTVICEFERSGMDFRLAESVGRIGNVPSLGPLLS